MPKAMENEKNVLAGLCIVAGILWGYAFVRLT